MRAQLAALLIFAALIAPVPAPAENQPQGEATMAPAAPRILRKSTIVETTTAEAYRAWTTSEGIKSFMGIDAKVECRIGGAYEWIFIPDAPEGQRGSEGCTVLSFVPGESVSFSWNAPPTIPTIRASGRKTQVCVRFTALGSERTRVDLVQSDFGEGADWDAYHSYFDKAWGSVLVAMREHFKRGLPAQKHWVYYVRPARDGFFDSPTPEETASVAAHAKYIAELTEKGVVRVAGPSFEPSHFPTGEKALPFDSPAPGVVIFRAADATEAKSVMDADPAIQAGVFKARLNEYHWAFPRE